MRFLASLDEDYNIVGEDFEIVIDVSDHIWEEIPDELEYCRHLVRLISR